MKESEELDEKKRFSRELAIALKGRELERELENKIRKTKQEGTKK